MQQINSIKFLKPEEIEAMKLVPMEITKQEIVSKDDIRRDAYSAIIHFSRLANYRVPGIGSDEFALLHYASGNPKIKNQFSMDVKVRFIETQWPKKDDREGFSTYMIQIYVDKELRWEHDLQRTGFLSVYLKGLKDGTLKGFEPVVRIPGAKEKVEPIQEEDKDKLPF